MGRAAGVTGLVLAGGEGRRMGGTDKAFIDLGGVPLVAHVTRRLAPQVDSLAISANGDPARFAAFGLPVLADAVPGRGPLGGVLSGLDHAAATGARSLVTVSVDTPFVPHDLVRRLAAAPGPVAMAESGGRLHGTVALWPVESRDALREALDRGMRKVRDWAGTLGVTPVAFESGAEDPFFNINTPDDLARAEAQLGRG